ncbi:D-glucuronyl C5-epimerase family protein [Pseudomonas sp. NBRC 111140]|uniref:D-glucuronyl C5-epimerase family protein n=1 Tax=Pseudomonas sp. NBRC 111140 TaxID=1661055 RepID=UPI000760EAB5|nr:D-glucuronyl C5-epimerase family protein [Pseudomonas sp. NBRC 111140]
MKIHYEALTSDWFDRAMSSGPNRGDWQPKHHLDLFRPWPEKYVSDYHQPFNPFAFAINACALDASSKKNGFSKTIHDQINYLDLAASIYTETIEDHDYIKNDFAFPMYWATMKKPFYGAFMNAYTAYGYMRLYEATKNEKYLNKSFRLIRTIISKDAKIKISGKDSKDDLWLYEYVFTPQDNEVEYLKKLGTEMQEDGKMRFRVYNGHIGAIIALMKFRKLTNMRFADHIIEQAILAMSKNLASQIFDNKYFSYSLEAVILPDYGQARAVHLAKCLAEATDDEKLKATASTFERFYSTFIKECERDTYLAGRDAARTFYGSLKNQAMNTEVPKPL